MIEIRPLEINELDIIYDLANEWYMDSKILNNFDLKIFKQNWINFISNKIGVILGVFKDNKFLGGIGGVLHPDPNNEDKIATEFFWYIDKKSRGIGLILLNRFEEWAKKNDCNKIRMSKLINESYGIDKIYLRKGYHPVEELWEKEI